MLESTYGAQPGERLGNLRVVFDLEQALAGELIPFTVLRAACCMTNWDPMLGAARQGVLPTMYPPGVAAPMVAPIDLGMTAKRPLRKTPERGGIRFVEGPARHSSQDVAAAFAAALGRDVRPQVMPRDRWAKAFRQLGFSDAAAAPLCVDDRGQCRRRLCGAGRPGTGHDHTLHHIDALVRP